MHFKRRTHFFSKPDRTNLWKQGVGGAVLKIALLFELTAPYPAALSIF